MTVVCKKARVEGKVQGVWFRASTREQADKLCITGWAKNLSDGSVEVVMHGEQAAIEQLINWLHQGPPTAVVHRVSVTDSNEALKARVFITA